MADKIDEEDYRTLKTYDCPTCYSSNALSWNERRANVRYCETCGPMREKDLMLFDFMLGVMERKVEAEVRSHESSYYHDDRDNE